MFCALALQREDHWSNDFVTCVCSPYVFFSFVFLLSYRCAPEKAAKHLRTKTDIGLLRSSVPSYFSNVAFKAEFMFL